ncbi:uncharacterized protein [Mytilus edulis]|uniref:uncharacterized protein n=1 Tax=Mytilus edulis TaxID=6550 RepID=UPI0039EEDCDB
MDTEECPAMDTGNEYDLVDISIYELSEINDTEKINNSGLSRQRSSFRNRRCCFWSIIFPWIVFPTTAGNLLPDVIGRRYSRDGHISSIVTLKTAVGILVVLMYIRFSPGRVEGLQLNERYLLLKINKNTSKIKSLLDSVQCFWIRNIFWNQFCCIRQCNWKRKFCSK